ncbi:MAG: hypothetical protein AVDCRST_MAG70-937, partial [uncultured Thermomicrobiales bacterium]
DGLGSASAHSVYPDRVCRQPARPRLARRARRLGDRAQRDRRSHGGGGPGRDGNLPTPLLV